MSETVTGAMIADEYGIEHDVMNDILNILRDHLGRMPRQVEIRTMLDALVPHVEPHWLAAAVAVWCPLMLTKATQP